MPPENEKYLAHHGVKGQRWGHRQWQNADGTYTEAGKHHYGWGYGRRAGSKISSGVSNGINSKQGMPPGTKSDGRQPQRKAPGTRVDGYQAQRKPMGTRSVRSNSQQRQPSQAEIEARKAKARKIIGIAAGVALAAGLSYGAYKGSTNLRDKMRSDVHKNFDTDPRNLHTLSSKYWDSSDRKKYSEMTAQRAKDVADNITRRDAVAAKFAEKTGVRISMPQSRKRVIEQRRSENRYSNFIRDAEKRGAMNKSIHDARADLKAAQKKLTTYKNTAHIGTSKQYEALWTKKHSENVELARERLNNLLLQRRAG